MGRPGIAVGSLCFVQFADVLGVTVVVTALPTMLHDLHASASAGSLVSTGYAMFFGGLLMVGARLGDRFGHRRAIVAGLAVFAAGATLGALAGSIATLTAARCPQGAGAALSVPSALRLLTTLTAEGAARRRAIAAWSAAGAAAGASGFVVGGVVTDLAGWRFIFWAYLPLAALMAAAVLVSVPPDRREPGAATELDLTGAALFTGATMAAIVGATLVTGHRGRAPGVALIAAAVGLAAACAAWERRARRPLLPAEALRRPTLRLGAAGSLLNTATTSSAMTVATLDLQDARHRSPLAAAAALLPFSLAVVAGSTVAAPALRRWPARQVVALGLAVIGVAVGALAATTSWAWGLPAGVAVAGLGLGLSSVAATTLGTDVPTASRSTAAGVVNTAAQLGTALGTAALLVVATAAGGVGPGRHGPMVAWVVAALVALLAAAGFAARFQVVRRSVAGLERRRT